jgi:endonuclease YncB( thermonuclease family)
MKPFRRRQQDKLRKFSQRAKLMVLLAALSVGVIYSFDDLAAEFRAMIGGRQPEAVSRGGPSLTGRVTHVRDADTIEVSGVPVRIANLDCAERGTAAGERAAGRMRQLVTLGPFSCQLAGRKSYDREVGLCALADGRDIGEILIQERQCGRWN